MSIETETKKNFGFDIRPNCAPSTAHCAICGRLTNLRVPFSIFKRGTNEPLCEYCANEHYPEAAEEIFGTQPDFSNHKGIMITCDLMSGFYETFLPSKDSLCVVYFIDERAHVLSFDRDFELSRHIAFTRDCDDRDTLLMRLPYREAKETLQLLGYKMEESEYLSLMFFLDNEYPLKASNVLKEYWVREENDCKKQSDNQNRD